MRSAGFTVMVLMIGGKFILHIGTKRIETGHRYHQRSLAESGMARDKRILGPPPAARSWEGQQTEGRIGCRAYSIG